MAKISTRQQEILNYIDSYQEENGFPPTLREICTAFSFSSTNGARYHVHRLKELGHLEVCGRKSRGVKRIGSQVKPKVPQNGYSMPLFGKVQAGAFDLANPDVREGEITIDPGFYGLQTESANLYGLRIEGDSMIDAGILEGDIVVVDPNRQARNGSIVVARQEDEATIKRYNYRGSEILLEPANKNYEPIRISNKGGNPLGQDVEILGVVVGVFRAF